MSNATKKSKTKPQDLFTGIVNEFIAQLEQGSNPFDFGRTQPVSLTTGNEYKNLNKLFLSYIALKNGFKSGKWATIGQINKAGGRVLKGSNSSPIFFFSNNWAIKAVKNGELVTIWSKQREKDDAIAEVKRKKGVTSIESASQKAILNCFAVFNIDQTTLEDEGVISREEQPAVIKVAVGNHVEHKDAQQIRYDENLDCIYGAQDDSLMFDHSTYFKAVIQSTGHETRLNRETEYVEEELVKLIGSSYLLGLTGLDQSPVSPQLAQVFVQKLKTSPNSLWKYARMADESYSMVSGWVKEMVSEKQVA